MHIPKGAKLAIQSATSEEIADYVKLNTTKVKKLKMLKLLTELESLDREYGSYDEDYENELLDKIYDLSEEIRREESI